MYSRNARACARVMLALGLVLAAPAVRADFTNANQPDAEEPVAEHAEQGELFDLVAAGQSSEAFARAFELGDELFETRFNSLDGVGANVGQHLRFSRVPRADLDGPGEWATHQPLRATGPNAQTCNDCHNQPVADGAGGASANVHRDPLHSGAMGSFITRNAPHLFGLGALQRLAEEMTAGLQGIREQARATACATGMPQSRALAAKGVSYGTITATPNATPCSAVVDTSAVAGVDATLVVKPFQWKGSTATLRDFNRDAVTTSSVSSRWSWRARGATATAMA
jgi:hypothetical protein